jgi:hypothetical protein
MVSTNLVICLVAFFVTLMREHLLTPSLGANAPSAAPYSTRSSFLVALFGGPLAILLYAALSSWRLRRPADIPVYAAGLALTVALMYAALVDRHLLAGVAAILGKDTIRFLSSALSLGLCGVFYLLHKKQHRSAALFGTKPPSPWIPAIICMVLGYFGVRGLGMLIAGMHP